MNSRAQRGARGVSPWFFRYTYAKVVPMNLYELHKIALDISDLEDKYDEFDEGHDKRHMNEVSDLAVRLAKKHGVKDLELVELAAKLHDIGRVKGRAYHAVTGAKMIRDDERFDDLGERRKQILISAVRNHMKHTGNHKGMIAKVVSDADDAAGWRSPQAAIHRSYLWGKKNHPEWSNKENLLNAVDYLAEEYGKNGPGRHTYFPETRAYIEKSHKTIRELARSHDLEKIRSLLKKEKKNDP